MKRGLLLIVLAVLLVPPGLAPRPEALAQETQPAPSEPDNNVWYVINLAETPLARGINDAWDRLPDKPLKEHDKKAPKALKHGDKTVGWASQNTMTLEYETAKQKDPKGQREDWEPAKVKVQPEKAKPAWAEATLPQVPQNSNRDPQGPTTLSGGFFSSYNDDLDCVDQVTADHLSGSDCFVGDPADHQLVPTLVEITIEDEPFCQHLQDTSVILPYDECVERGWTTLVESIDEDGPEDPDSDNDGNTDDVPNAENDDRDCTEQVEVGQDDQGNPIYELQWFGEPDCYDGDGNLVDGRLPLIDEDLVDLEGNAIPIDNDGDGAVDEDPVGELGNPQDDAAMCESLYNQMDVAFDPSEDYDEATGECNLDHAITKGVNQKTKARFGKNVFTEGDPDDDANDWSKAYTAEGKSVEHTYPDIGKSHPYHIVLTVTDTSQPDKPNKCNSKVTIPGDGQPVHVDCQPEDPSADFTVTCTEWACIFEADASGDTLTYAWDLGNIPKGEQSKFPDKDKAYGKGKEPRKVTVTETVVARCKPGWEYEEDPDSLPDAKKIRCKSPKLDAAQTVQSSLALEATGATSLASSDPSSYDAMMGFTFAPPVIGWGWKIEEEACIFGWCFEIFYARVGYEFDLGAGLRLPVQMDVQPLDDNWPQNVRAEQEYEFSTTITPLDFSRQEYVQFCTDHRLNDEWYIDSCDRFSFPDFLNSEDGDEFVAYYSLFAGIIVRVLQIPVITWGVDSSFDLAQACTMYNALNAVGLDPDDPDLAAVLKNLATLMGDYLSGDAADFYQFLKDAGILCGSFTTPYGYEPVDDPLEDGRRTFPFSLSYSIPADCTKAYLEGSVVTIKGRPVPICTNLILGTAGANLGIGLELELEAGSENIGAEWSTERDANPASGAQTDVMWHWPESWKADESPPQIIGPVRYDNYDLTRDLANDEGIVEFDDFTYYLDFWLAVYANLEFGGILSPIPDLARFKLFDISFGDIFGVAGIPLPQHPGMDPLELPAPVENYGLEAWTTPENVPVPNPDSREFNAQFDVTLTNLGSRPGTFDNFRYELSNVRDQQPPYTYGMNHDNDRDGRVDEDGPSPGVCRADPRPEGCQRDDDGDGLYDEDPAADDWTANLTPQLAGPAEPYTGADPLTLTVFPFQHGMTGPGLYPVQIVADSVEAKVDPQLAALFPADPAQFPYYYNVYDHIYGRRDVYDVAFVQIEAFYDPQVNVTPDMAGAKPGVPAEYSGSFVNGGNMADSMTVTTSTVDWNTAGCTLTTLGTLSGCPYRAVPTRIPEEWLVDGFSGDYGPFEPCQGSEGHVSVLTAPTDWAGMTDTPYEFVVQTQSHGDPMATNAVTRTYTVQATKESMTRYIGLEIDELIAQLEEASAQGVHTCGLLPIVENAIKRQNDRALALILNGKLDQASKALAAGAHIVEGAFLHALEGCDAKIAEEPWRADWRQRGQAILADLWPAADCMIESAR